jgi:alpha-beta hydrolase superfamily lysophospholipase
MKRPLSAGRKLFYSLFATFLLINVVAAMHAYKFTHFNGAARGSRTGTPASLSFGQRIETLFLGIKNARPQNNALPQVPFETVHFSAGGNRIESWWLPVTNPRGTVIIFHGYLGEKSGMLNKAYVLRTAGYNTLLVDFRGSGGSEGNSTTLGFWEAEEVGAAYDHILKKTTGPIYLYGTSMGAVAILKALSESNLQPAGIVLECPFGSLYQTVAARFRNMGVPAFPMAGLLLFWGGAENGFWAAGHNPARYAGSVRCPALLLWGREDASVSAAETRAIYTALKGPKMLKIWEGMGHQDYLRKEPQAWPATVLGFLQNAQAPALQK